MQMLKKLFKSNDKFHLELDEIVDSEVVQTAVETASKAADAVKEKAAEVASSQPVKEAVEATKEAAESAQDKLASALGTDEKPSEAKSATAKAKPKEDKKALKESTAKAKPKENKKAPAKESTASKNGKVTESTSETKSTPDSTNTGASSYEPPFWVAAMYNTNNGAADNNGQVAEQTFATDNLMPTPTKFRRRPGGSLDKFKNMAKQAKTPKN